MSNNKRAICWACGGWYGLSIYVLFTDKNPKGHKVLKDNQKRFDDNLKDKIFKKDVEAFKAVAQTTDEIWRRRKPLHWYKTVVEEFERAIGKMNVNLYKVFASVFYFLKKSYILDSGSSTYMTKNKHRLFRYKPASSKDRLKYGRGYIAIQGYRDLDIQFID